MVTSFIILNSAEEEEETCCEKAQRESLAPTPTESRYPALNEGSLIECACGKTWELSYFWKGHPKWIRRWGWWARRKLPKSPCGKRGPCGLQTDHSHSY